MHLWKIQRRGGEQVPPITLTPKKGTSTYGVPIQ